MDIREDRVGLLGLLQRLALLNPLEAVVHPIQDVPHRPLAGQVLIGIAARLQGDAHLGGREVGVAACRLQFGIGVGMRLDDRADVGGESGVLLLAALAALGGEVLPAAHPGAQLVEPLLDRIASPAEASFGQARATAAELGGDLGLEESALVSGEASGAGADQSIEAFTGFVHGSGPTVPNR